MPSNYIVSDPWLSSLLDHPAFQVEIDDDALVENVLHHLHSIWGKKFRLCKNPNQASIYSNHLLKNQFYRADTNITFDKEIQGESYQSNCHSGHTCEQDKSQVMELADRSFLLSRFHQNLFLKILQIE